MKEVVIRFATLNPQNVIPYIYLAMGIVWVAMVVAAALSLRSQDFALRWKLCWALAIVLIPILGMAVYAVFCLFRADYPLLHQMGMFRKDPVRYGLSSK